MKLLVNHQERYSRLELILRSLFGIFYIYMPHGFLLFFVGIWGAILSFITFWIVLFTGKFPVSFYEFQVGLHRWKLRVFARRSNISDGYPAFGINATDPYTSLEIPYPENISRGLVLVRFLFGFFFVLLPHGFILFFRWIYVGILIFLAWWAVLFTANYPQSFHSWVVGQFRWSTRVSLYMQFLTDKYPPFTGDELVDEKIN